MTEEEIARIFGQVAQDLDHPRIHAVVAGAERRGVQIRRRRRAYSAAGSVLAVGALAVGGAAITVLPQPPAAPGTPAGGQPDSQQTSAPAPGNPVRTPNQAQRAGASTGQMTTTQIMDQLRAMLPAGSTISDVRSDATGDVEFDYNDGHGAVDFIFFIEPLSFYQSPLSCSQPRGTGPEDHGPRPPGALPPSCVKRTLPGGSIELDSVEYADARGFYGYDVTDQRPDGTVVQAQIGNGINHTLPQVDRAVPPGSLAEWNALVQSSVWHL
jgi:hypothetical protein